MFSQDYLKQLQQLHDNKSRPRGFGGKVKDLGQFHNFMKKWNPKTLLDYGCGKGSILEYLDNMYPNVEVLGYDPAVSIYASVSKNNFDCVFCNDVLEHIEPNFIDLVLQDICNYATKNVWLRIDTRPARKSLPDGRNAHLILESKEWWEDKINYYINGEIVYSVLNKKGKLDIAIEK